MVQCFDIQIVSSIPTLPQIHTLIAYFHSTVHYCPPSFKVMKVCFVTVGATAAFPDLIAAVANEQFFKLLAEKKFTHLFVQYGAHGRYQFDSCLDGHYPGDAFFHGIDVTGFDFQKDLNDYMGMAMEKKPYGKHREHQELGLMISHAGK